MSAPVAAATERSEVPERYRWDLTPVYADWDAWERDFAAVSQAVDELAALGGALAAGAADLLNVTEALLDAHRRYDLVRLYASLRSDEDTRIGDHTERRGRASTLGVRLAEAASWFEPELLALDDDELARRFAELPELRIYEHFFDDIRRNRPHTLPREQEALLASAGALARGASAVFSALDNADLRFPEVGDENGARVELTKARYNRLIRSRERAVREGAFVALHDAYGRMRNTLAANFDAGVRSHVFYARARRHRGTLEAALHRSAVPTSVYHNLIAAVRERLPAVHRCVRLKRRLLGVEAIHGYDLSAPLFPEDESERAYEPAVALMLEALAPLGETYVDVVRGGVAARWLDVRENAGKRSGAYSSGAFGVPPYILLNWSGRLRDVFTLAHEMGHSLHTWLANRSQPFVYSDYPIFTAEVASTFNEQLLHAHLLSQADGRDAKLALLDLQLDQILGTVVRQTMLAEFEHAAHRIGEEDGTLTADRLDAIYADLLREYWGPDLADDGPRAAGAWSRIPHFYYNYYVYQYATAFSASVALSRRVLDGGPAEREAYLDALRSGSSRYPVDTLRAAGVDMTTAAPVHDVFDLFESSLDEIEKLSPAEDTA